MLLIDAHAHIYDCYDLNEFLNAASSNFNSVANQFGCKDNYLGTLLLSETSKDNWFSRLSEYAKGNTCNTIKEKGSWNFYRTNESISLYAKSDNSKSILLIAGQQVLTAEGLEVLALATTDRYENGISIGKLIKYIGENNGIPVLPWGVGKWFGNRGKIITSLIKNCDTAFFFLGDNSGRPFFWRQPRQFKLARAVGIKILPGSDPLPFPSQQTRTGRFGSIVKGSIEKMEPARILRRLLFDKKTIVQPYGKLENFPWFLVNQLRMQCRKKSKI